MLEITAVAVLAFWLALLVDRRRSWPDELTLNAESASAPPTSVSSASPGGSADPVVVAVVPARDEADLIGQALAALLRQEIDGRFEVLLVDDNSTDGTAEIAGRAAQAVGGGVRLHVVENSPTPPGWAGKVHALSRGVEVASERDVAERPEWFLFTDADIEHRDGSVRALLNVAATGSYDLVSVMARLNAETFWERLLIPPFVFFFQLLYPFRLVSRESSNVAAAAGGCVLVRRAALERAGGLASIQGALIDDVALARSVHRAGGRLWLGFDPGIRSLRRYDTLGELWSMVSRSAFVQLRYRYDWLVAVLLGLAVFFVSPPLVALLAGVKTLAGNGSLAPAALAAALLTCLLQTLALYPSARHHRVPLAFAVSLPLASALYGMMTFSSAWSHLRGRGSRWKGRSYSGTGAGTGTLTGHDVSS